MANRIYQLRKQNNLTQQQLADRLGLSKATIALYESGKTENIKGENLIKMSDVLDASPSYIMGWSTIRHEITPREEKLVEGFRSLNSTGKKQLEIRLWELSCLLYSTRDIINSEERQHDCLMPVAAHADEAEPEILKSEIERVRKLINGR